MQAGSETQAKSELKWNCPPWVLDEIRGGPKGYGMVTRDISYSTITKFSYL